MKISFNYYLYAALVHCLVAMAECLTKHAKESKDLFCLQSGNSLVICRAGEDMTAAGDIIP